MLDAAYDLFARNGVSATSLQMIADAMGVTKAAIYYQFKTKDEIVIALTERQLAGLEDVLEAAEAEPSRLRARELLLERVVDLAVKDRRMVSVLQFDPVIVRLLADHAPFQEFITRLYRAMLGDEADTAARVQAAMLSGAISVAVMHPLVADVPDEELKFQLLHSMRKMINLRE